MIAKIGLTGGIGSGKSAVANCFEALGVYVIDADQVSRILMQPGTPYFDSIVAHFGEEVLLSTGELDRKAIGKQVFSNPDHRVFLEQLLHPAIRSSMHQAVEQNADVYGVMEIPLLLEGEQQVHMDKVIVVTCPTPIRIRRLQDNRGMSLNMIEKVMNTQLSDEEKIEYADDIIVNDGSLNDITEQVTKLHQKYLAEFA